MSVLGKMTDIMGMQYSSKVEMNQPRLEVAD